MADYQKMYAILCGAIDDVIPSLESIPPALSCARRLCAALEQAETLYLDAADTPLQLFPARPSRTQA